MAVGLEYSYRVMPGSFWSHLWLIVPANTIIAYAVYRLVTVPGVSLIDAFIVWSACTIGARVAVSVVVLGDPVAKGTWAALILVIAARVVQTTWRS